MLGGNGVAVFGVPTTVRHNDEVKETPRQQTFIRRSDEPKLEIGDVVPIKQGVVGVVLFRFIPSYIVELTSDEE